MSVELTALAVGIKRAHESAQQCAANAVEYARTAGELLLQAKESVAHGQWLLWLSENVCEVSERTAQSYMRLARECLDDPAKAQRVADLSLRAALHELAEPKPTLTADVPNATRGSHFDPFTFKDRLTELDDIPLRRGHVTVGRTGDAVAIVILESRKHPGYWHDIDLRHGSASKRPVKPLGIAWRFANEACVWTTEPDDGQLLQLCETSSV